MKSEKGNWKVVRNCCTSGYCVDCKGIGIGTRPRRIVHADNYSEAYAKWVASNWQSYAAKAEPMSGSGS